MNNALGNSGLHHEDDQVNDLTFDSLARDWKAIAGRTLSDLKEEILANQISELQRQTTGLGTSVLNIFDIEENKFLYVGDSVEQVTGIPKKYYFSRGPKYIFTKATLGHLPKIISSTIHQRRFFSNIPPSTYDNFIVNREFSYRGEQPRWVLHQVLKHLKNPQGKIFATAILQTSIASIKNDSSFRYYIYNKKENAICYPKQNKHTVSHSLDSLSSREIEIVNLLKSGLSNKQVAESLHISFHTVRTHRKNIFKKLNCTNVVELIQLLG